MGKGRATMTEAHALAARLPRMSRYGEVVSLAGEPWIVRSLRYSSGLERGGLCAAGFVSAGRQRITARSEWLESAAWDVGAMVPIKAGWLVHDRLVCPIGDGAYFDAGLVRAMFVPGSSWRQADPVTVVVDGRRVRCRPLQIAACNWRAVVMPLHIDGVENSGR